MCQMLRINQLAAVRGTESPNELYDKYQVEFGYLLNPRAGGHDPGGTTGFYLRDDGIYKSLRNILFPMSHITVLLGEKGRGKSGAIKDAFDCVNNEIMI